MAIMVPWPFITQGATPLHVYDADLVPSNGAGCLAPDIVLADAQSVILLEDWIQETGYTAPAYLNCDQVDELGEDGWCTLTLDISQDVIDATTGDKLYVNLHMDYGLKGQNVDANPFDLFEDRYDRGGYVSPWGSSDALMGTSTDDGPLAIADCSVYGFAHDVGICDAGVELGNSCTVGATSPDACIDGGGTCVATPQLADEVQNLNIFKQISGAFGRVFCADTDSGVPGILHLELEGETDYLNALFVGDIDEDGYFVLGYKHKGKATNYQIRWCDMDDCAGDVHETDPFPLQANTTVEIDIEAIDSCDDLNGPDDGSDWEMISPVYFKGKFKN